MVSNCVVGVSVSWTTICPLGSDSPERARSSAASKLPTVTPAPSSCSSATHERGWETSKRSLPATKRAPDATSSRSRSPALGASVAVAVAVEAPGVAVASSSSPVQAPSSSAADSASGTSRCFTVDPFRRGGPAIRRADAFRCASRAPFAAPSPVHPPRAGPVAGSPPRFAARRTSSSGTPRSRIRASRPCNPASSGTGPQRVVIGVPSGRTSCVNVSPGNDSRQRSSRWPRRRIS